MRSLAVESATEPCGFWPGAQKKCFGFVRSELRDEAADAPSAPVRTASAASTQTRFMWGSLLERSIWPDFNDRARPQTNLDPIWLDIAAGARFRLLFGSASVWKPVRLPPKGGVTAAQSAYSMGQPNDRRRRVSARHRAEGNLHCAHQPSSSRCSP